MKQKSNHLILASASPRRRLLLRKAGIRFRIIPSGASETYPRHLQPAGIVKYLALRKAWAVARKFPNDVVLGADTLVFLGKRTIGKPRNPKEAKRILNQLSGAWQRVYTGVALVSLNQKLKKVGVELSWVKFRELSKADIDRASSRHLDKAGAYSIQQKGDDFVEKLKGNYDNVVGLPVTLVKKMLRNLRRGSSRNGLKRH